MLGSFADGFVIVAFHSHRCNRNATFAARTRGDSPRHRFGHRWFNEFGQQPSLLSQRDGNFRRYRL